MADGFFPSLWGRGRSRECVGVVGFVSFLLGLWGVVFQWLVVFVDWLVGFLMYRLEFVFLAGPRGFNAK